MSEEEKLVQLLTEKGYTITTAESCTGGLISATIVNAPGASEVLNEAYVTYANESKEKFAFVSHETLEKHGAVSKETAKEMAQGAAKNAGANVALSSTGIAGPGGGTPEKPVGLVYIGCYVNGEIQVKKCNFDGDRREVREKTVKLAISMAINMLDL